MDINMFNRLIQAPEGARTITLQSKPRVFLGFDCIRRNIIALDSSFFFTFLARRRLRHEP